MWGMQKKGLMNSRSHSKEEERVQMLSICEMAFAQGLKLFAYQLYRNDQAGPTLKVGMSPWNISLVRETFVRTPSTRPPPSLRERALVGGVRPQSCWGRSCARCPADHR